MFNMLEKIIWKICNLKENIFRIKNNLCTFISNLKRSFNEGLYNIKKYAYMSLFVFVILSSMIPNSKNSSNLKYLNTIIPQIDNVYSDDKDESDENLDNSTYSFKLFEIISNIF